VAGWIRRIHVRAIALIQGWGEFKIGQACVDAADWCRQAGRRCSRLPTARYIVLRVLEVPARILQGYIATDALLHLLTSISLPYIFDEVVNLVDLILELVV